eukprot:120382_1
MSCDHHSANSQSSCYIDCRLRNKKSVDAMNDNINSLGFCHLMGRDIDTSTIYNKQPDPNQAELFTVKDCFTVKDTLKEEAVKAIFVCTGEQCKSNSNEPVKVSWQQPADPNQNSNSNSNEPVKVSWQQPADPNQNSNSNSNEPV